MGCVFQKKQRVCFTCGTDAQPKPCKRPRECMSAGHLTEIRTLPIWWIKYSQNGAPQYESSGSTKKTVALNLLKDKEGDIAKGIPVSSKINKITLEEAAEDIRNDYRINNLRSVGHLETRLTKHLVPALGARTPLIAIDTAVARKYAGDRITKGAKPATINRELAILRRRFTLALDAKKISAAPKIEMLEENNARTGFFEAEQLAAVLAHLPKALRHVVRFAAVTGWRRSEIIGKRARKADRATKSEWDKRPLDWAHVDFKTNRVWLDKGTTKNKEGRVFKMTRELRALLEERWAVHQELARKGKLVPWVFCRGSGEPIESFAKTWKAACQKAGCPGRILHDLRRTAIRNMIRRGIPDLVAMQLSGHKTRDVFDRYNIVSEGDLDDAARRLDAGDNFGDNREMTVGRGA